MYVTSIAPRVHKEFQRINHACKCYWASLEKLAANNPIYKGKGGLTEKMQKRLTSSARCAIKMRSQERNKIKGLALIQRDLIHGPYHCFDHHSNCSPDVCQAVRSDCDISEEPVRGDEESTNESASDIDCTYLLTTF